MITYEEALARIRERVLPLRDKRVVLQAALGRVLAENVEAPFDLPRFDNSAVDGYGVRLSEPGPLQVIGTLRAGDAASEIEVRSGQAVKILTGAPVPESVQAVVMQEDVEPGDGVIELKAEVEFGQNIRRKGEEALAGTVVLSANTPLTPPAIALLASLGRTECRVFRRPRAAILATGNELKEVGTSLREGEIFDSNSLGIAAALEMLGVPLIESRRTEDSFEETLDSLFEMLCRADIVITSGGVSVGEYDLVRRALFELGVDEVFWRVAIKPGKPVYFGVWDGPEDKRTYVFGLPGNPVSALVTLLLLVRPAVKGMVGLSAEPDLTVFANLAAPLRKATPRLDFVRARLRRSPNELLAIPLERQGSHMSSGLAGADALIHFPRELSELEAGARVEVTPIRWSLY